MALLLPMMLLGAPQQQHLPPNLPRRDHWSPLWHQQDFAKALHDSAGRPMELALEPESERGYRAVPPTADVRPAADDLGIVLRAPEDVVAATVASLRAHARL